jgi:ATP-dependent Clp protease ATP-binding subunit ClpC
VVSRWTGVPITSIKEEETQKLLPIEEEPHERVISQDKAINALVRAIRRRRAGLKNSNKPIGSFLFLGPTGVAKTEVARTLAQFMFGGEKSLVRFDMSEFMEKHSVSHAILILCDIGWLQFAPVPDCMTGQETGRRLLRSLQCS